MRRSFRYSKQAKIDLRRIFYSSVLLFGPIQARRYSSSIIGNAVRLPRESAKGRPLTVRGVDYLSRLIGSHMPICSVDPDARLRVVRILHSRMDLQRHL